MAAPDQIVLPRHRDLGGRANHPWVRRTVLAVIAVPLALALTNLLGQRPAVSSASGGGATLSVNAPARLRGGLLFTVSYRVAARRDLAKATLVLDPGWISGMQVNSLTPQPLSEGSRDGKVVLVLGHIRAGHSYTQFVEYQVDPTTVGRHRADVELADGDRHLATVRHTITVLP